MNLTEIPTTEISVFLDSNLKTRPEILDGLNPDLKIEKVLESKEWTIHLYYYGWNY